MLFRSSPACGRRSAGLEENAVASGYAGTRPLSEELLELKQASATLAQYVTFDDLFLVDRATRGAKILFEGAQSIELDVVKGATTYVTSSHTVPGYAYIGGDLPPKFHRYTIGVAKAIMSRVGNGPMPGEFGGARSASYCADKTNSRVYEREHYDPSALLSSQDSLDVGKGIRIMTGEYGVGTGRPRRIGMLDLIQLRRAVQMAGADLLFLNKCDCLTLFSKTAEKKIPVLTGYSEGRSADYIVQHFAAFTDDALGTMRRDDLPKSLKEMLQFVEGFVGCPLLGMGFGPDRERNIVSYEIFNDAA
jgi:adenylosuccinate synthase